MNKEQVIELSVKYALDWQEEQRQKQTKSRQDRRLRNTKLLLKNYHLLKEHCEKSIYNLQQTVTADKAIDILDELDKFDSTEYIASIKRSVTRTFIIITHIDTMLQIYEVYCQKSNQVEDYRRFRILKAYYLLDHTPSQIIRDENIEMRTYYRDLRTACIMLGSLIFGIDSILEP